MHALQLRWRVGRRATPWEGAGETPLDKRTIQTESQ